MMYKLNPKWSDKQQEKWRVVQKRGKWRFIILHGCLGWGIPMAILMFLMSHFIIQPDLPYEKTILLIVLLATISPICGIGAGAKLWSYMQWQFYEYARNKTAREH